MKKISKLYDPETLNLANNMAAELNISVFRSHPAPYKAGAASTTTVATVACRRG